MSDEVGRCGHCQREIKYRRFSAGLGNQGFMYCDSDPTVVSWSSYDPTYARLAAASHPWMLDTKARAAVEAAVIACPRGGRFTFSALPRCPHCNSSLPELAETSEYYVVLAHRIDGDAGNQVWREG
jgi:hypothetical protein